MFENDDDDDDNKQYELTRSCVVNSVDILLAIGSSCHLVHHQVCEDQIPLVEHWFVVLVGHGLVHEWVGLQERQHIIC